MKRLHTALLLVWLLIYQAPGQAARYLAEGPYQIHYASIRSTDIPAMVAQQHGIVRASNRHVLTISVLKEGTPVSAEIRGSSRSLLDQRRTLEFIEVREQDSIYYLASTIVSAGERLEFEIKLVLPDLPHPLELQFEQDYY